MASTQYQIFCRYLNENVNRALTNKTIADWISAEEYKNLNDFYNENEDKYKVIKQDIIDGATKENYLDAVNMNIYTTCKKYEEIQDKIDKQKIVIEHCIVEPADSLYNDNNGSKRKSQVQRDLENYQIVIDEAIADNPKYDMVFMYSGITKAESITGKADYNPSNVDDKQIPYVYYERMQRVKLDPWFLHSSYASLNSAMARAKELVNLLGKDSVKIGKVVPLEQYIEIV